MSRSNWNGPLTGRQLVTIIVIAAVLVGVFFGVRSSMRQYNHEQAVSACVERTFGYGADCEHHPNIWKP